MLRLHWVLLIGLLGACGSHAGAADDGDDDDVTAPDAEPGIPDAASPCGTCPTGSTCGTSNGVDVCVTDTGIPRFEHIFVILMENTSYQTLVDTTNTPYIHALMADGAISSEYHGVEHPSLSNYIAMTSGMITDNGALDCDCEPTGGECGTFTCNFATHSCGCPQAQANLADQLDAAGISWKAYAEAMGTPCNLTSAGSYAVKHVPFLYFPTLTDDTARCAAHVVDYDAFAGELATAPRFTFITPDLTHDMHDPVPAGAQNYANGDTWLAQEVPAILASQAFLDRGLLLIVWDEDDLSGVLAPDDPVPFIAMSPLARQAYVGTTRIDHYALLATIEDAFGVPRLGAAASATPLAEFFPTGP
jgi:hypothetical protein